MKSTSVSLAALAALTLLAVPAAAQTSPEAPDAPAAVTTALRVRSNEPGLALHRLTTHAELAARAGHGHARGELVELSAVCTAPCETTLAPGTYQLGVSRNDGDAVFAGEPLALDRAAELQLSYEDRSAFRIAGWTTFGAGFALGTAFMIASELSDENIIDAPLLITGLVVYAVGIAVGFPLVFLNDSAHVELRF